MASKFALMFLVLSMAVLPSTLATNYVVGGNLGWNLGVDFAAWLASKSFHVGDTLHFDFTSPHTVAVVDQSAYLSCDASHPISNDVSGSFTFTLSSSGVYSFISAWAGDCDAGLKMQVVVS
ncbi:hypothetical protein Salat_1146600 [Sesamum alatum]|uniref:Phytocyanin domain-containing protein n=1 Tax=Sesamum alatum TaxID=300844 RepID=A0AAE1YDW9_9LAMI|nr:hypothetical protein Salat_1146600 [Sesamum alatum]